MASWSGARKQVKTKPSSYDTNIVSSFTLEKPVTLVATLDNSTAWFGYHSESYLMMANESGEITKQLKVKFKIDHIVVDSSGDLLMSDFEGNSVKKLTKSGEVVNFIDTAPFQSRGLCVNERGEVLVSLSSIGEGGEVRRVSPSGEIIQQIRYKKGTTNNLFRVPFRVKQSITGDICVLDAALSRTTRSALILDADGNLKFTYPSEGDPIQRRFCPMNVETDVYGNFLIGDTICGIHLLDEDGIFIQFILSKGDGLELSRGISIDPSGKLWICSTGNNNVLILTYDKEPDEQN